MISTNIKIGCADGYELDAILLEPESELKAVIQFNSATATCKEFYLSFAYYLVENGFAVILFDYRGIGGSIPKDGLKNSTIKYLDWSELDMTAVMNFITERFANIPKIIFGHSVGGQKVGFMPNLSNAIGMITVATSVGYLNFMPIGYRLQSYFFFYLVAPISHLLFGYTAAKKIGIMENLPKNITIEWRRWCNTPDYFFDKKEYQITVPAGQYKNFPIPVKIFYASDDPISNERSTKQFWKHVNSKYPIDIEKLDPKLLKLKVIGHFGFFYKKSKATIWPKALYEIQKLLINQENN